VAGKALRKPHPPRSEALVSYVTNHRMPALAYARGWAAVAFGCGGGWASEVLDALFLNVQKAVYKRPEWAWPASAAADSAAVSGLWEQRSLAPLPAGALWDVLEGAAHGHGIGRPRRWR
jgi:hypothetical protein